MEYSEFLDQLESLANPEAVRKMAKYGITPDKAYGVSIPDLRGIADVIEKNHELAGWLWLNGSRETRILAGMVDDPLQVTEEQMERWAGEFDYWEICDQCCMNLFEKTPLAWQKAVEWSGREDESHKRAGFVLMARLVVSDKKAADEKFEPFLQLITKEAGDDRNLVKKAINWALRQIGKRNLNLNARAIETAEGIKAMDSRAAKWVASDALRELKSEAVQKRLRK